MRTVPTETLLTANEEAALVGNYEGTVRTVIFSDEQVTGEINKWLDENFRRAEHLPKTNETTKIRIFGPLSATEHPNQDSFNITTIEVSFNTYQDEFNNLSVRAVYNPVLGKWTVADL